MSNIRLFFSANILLNSNYKLDKSQSHYLTKVMRVKVGESFSLFNKNGEWKAKIYQISKSIVEFSIIEKLRQKENTKTVSVLVGVNSKLWSKTCTRKTIPSQWSSFVCSNLQGLIPCLEFTIEIESNNLMYNPNKEIRDRVFPVKIGKFSVKYYTF